jgi:xylan 1,4-beta-xylosidase
MSRPIQNPIIQGFNPDPSILRDGEDYYIVTGTFEWHPGIQIHHSRNLRDWVLIGHALTTTDRLDLFGVSSSSGIWAPSLSWYDGLYCMVYTVVRTRSPRFKDMRNYVITAEDILGPWSQPVFLNATGFDPSLFHDDKGRKWVVNVKWDHRDGHLRFAGIILQKYDPGRKRLVGAARTILQKEILVEGVQNLQGAGKYTDYDIF